MNVKTWMVSTFAGLMILSALGIATIQANDAEAASIDERAIRARLAEIQDAAQRLDADAVFSFVLENERGSLIQDGKLHLTRDAAFESTKQGLRGLREISYRFDQQHVTILSPTAAIAVGDGETLVTTSQGAEFKIQFAQSVVLTKKNGEWKVLHSHRSSLANR